MYLMYFRTSFVFLVSNVFQTYSAETMTKFERDSNCTECRGRLFTGIYISTCAALCHDTTAELYLLGAIAQDEKENCIWFHFETSDCGETGNCTLCFSASSLHNIINLEYHHPSSMTYIRQSTESEVPDNKC